MKPRQITKLLPAAILLSSLQAATIDKADNADNLNLPSSWTGGIVPGPADVARWAGLASANTTSLGDNLSLGGIALSTTGGNVTIQGGQTLSLGGAGIDMATASHDLTLSSNLFLTPGSQSWNVPAGRSITLQSGTFARDPGAILNLQGAGSVSTSMTGLQVTNGILGPWAFAGTDVRYVTLSADQVVPYTTATPLSGITGVFGGIPSGGTGTLNYDVSGTGDFSVYGLVRSINTLRYTGGGANQLSNTSADLLTINGILNAGTGPLAIGGGVHQLRVVIGAGNNLVLAAKNADITIANPVRNGSATGSVVVHGSANVTLGGVNTYTGATIVSSGNLTLGANNSINASSGLIVRSGTATFGNFNPVGTANMPPVTIHSGATVTMDNGWSVNMGTIHLDGGDLSSNGLYNDIYGSYYLRGPVLATASDSTISAAEITAPGDSTFTVAAGGNLNVTGTLSNRFGLLGLIKDGPGTLTLSNTNTYPGNTLVNEGTLAISGAGAIVNSPEIRITSPGSLDVSGSSFSLGATQTLAGTGSIAGPFNHQPGATLSPGATGTTGTLTFTNNLNLSGGASILLDFDESSNDSITVQGDLLPENVTDIVFGNLPQDGLQIGSSHVLFTVAGTLGGSPANFNLPALATRKQLSLSYSGQNVVMNVTGAPPATLLWRGTSAPSDIWAVESGQNWTLAGTPAQYFDDDTVHFTNAGLGRPNIEIQGTVLPASVLVDAAGDYTFGGNGSIGGTASLLKKNTGSLTLASFHEYSGGTTVENGALILGLENALPLGSLLTLGNGTDSGVLKLDGWSQSLAGIEVSGSGANNRVINGMGSPATLTLTASGYLDAILGGTGPNDNDFSLATSGGASVTLTAHNTFNGGITASGTSNVALETPTASGSGPITLAGGSLSTAGAEALVLANGNEINNTSAGNIVFNGPEDLTTTGTLTYDPTANAAVVNSFSTLTVGNLHAAGPAVFVKNGNGTLVVNGPTNANVDGILVRDGTLVMNHPDNTFGGETAIGFNGAGTRIGTVRAAASETLGSSTIHIGPGGNDATASLELTGGISLSNPFILPFRNDPSPSIRNLSGNNSLTGPFTLTFGGVDLGVASEAGLLTLGSAGSPLLSSIPSSASRTITLGGAGDGIVEGDLNLINEAVVINLRKTGSGTWTIAGSLAFSGSTTVLDDGTLRIATDDVFADTSTLTLAGPSSLELTHGGTDRVGSLVIDGVSQPDGIYPFGTGSIQVGEGVNPYQSWAAAQGLDGTPGKENGPNDDPDRDGSTNLSEFAFHGNPLSSSDKGITKVFITDTSNPGNDRELVLTLAVRAGAPAFTGSPSPSSTVDGITYSIQGSTTLASFLAEITPVDPVTNGLPDLTDTGYEYRSFSLAGSAGLAGKGFIRAAASAN